MTRKNFNPGPDHGQLDFSNPEINPEVTQPVEQAEPTQTQQEWDRSVGKIYINEIRRMLSEGISQEEVLEVINERIKALGAKPVEESTVVEQPVIEEAKVVKEEPKSEKDLAKEYDKNFSELVSEIFDQIERNYPSPDMALAQAERKARQQLGPRPVEKVETKEGDLESKWLGYFKPQTLLNMINATSKLNSASGRVAQGMMHIDNPSLTMKKRGSDIYRPIEAQVKFLVSRGVLSGSVRDLSVAMFNDFLKDFGGRQYGGAVYHPRNNSLKQTMDSLSNRIYLLKESMKKTQDPILIATYKDSIKDLAAKKKAHLSTIIKSMSDAEKIEHEAFKNRNKLKKSLEK